MYVDHTGQSRERTRNVGREKANHNRAYTHKHEKYRADFIDNWSLGLEKQLYTENNHRESQQTKRNSLQPTTWSPDQNADSIVYGIIPRVDYLTYQRK